MSLLDLYEKKIANSIEKNFYTDTTPFANAVQKNTLRFQQTNEAKAVIPAEGNIYSGRNEYTDKDSFAPIATSAPVPALGRFDVFALGHWLRNISQEFGLKARPDQTNDQRSRAKAKGIVFAASQFLLATFNSGELAYGGPLNQIYNPLSIPLSALPLLRGSTTLGTAPTLAGAISLDGKVFDATRGGVDRLLLMRKGLYLKPTDANDIAQLRRNTPGVLQSEGGIPYSIEDQIDQTGGALLGDIQTNTYSIDNPYTANPAFDLAWLEEKLDGGKTANEVVLETLFKGGGFPSLPFKSALFSDPSKGVKYSWVAGKAPSGNTRTKPTSFPDNVDVAFEGDDETGTTKANIPDDQNYMPFMFQDLRDKTATFLYFRAFLKDTINETFSPNWQSDNYYGRVDEVPVYQNTARNIDISFDIVAWSPKDLPAMYAKMSKLQSMVYPSYDTNNYLQSGPLIRMRVGDLICASKKNGIKQGLPGFINSLSFSYDDGIWNLKDDLKVPRKVTVNIGFTVIHEGNPGNYVSGFGNQYGALVDDSVSAADIRGVLGSVAGYSIPAFLQRPPF